MTNRHRTLKHTLQIIEKKVFLLDYIEANNLLIINQYDHETEKIQLQL
jgi:hypothetical protein